MSMNSSGGDRLYLVLVLVVPGTSVILQIELCTYDTSGQGVSRGATEP